MVVSGLLCPVSGFPVQGRYEKLELVQWRANLVVKVLEGTVCEKKVRKNIFLSLEGRKD